MEAAAGQIDKDSKRLVIRRSLKSEDRPLQRLRMKARLSDKIRIRLFQLLLERAMCLAARKKA